MKFTPTFSTTRFLLLTAILLAGSNNKMFAQTTWTGTVSTAWNTAGNWSAGVPDAADDVSIPNLTNDPLISTSGISVKSITVQTGGILTISTAGVLNINGAGADGFLNQGTVHNNGIINMGNTTAAAADGIQNEAVFNNNSGAQLNIDRTSGGASPLINAQGAFTNGGTITIGAISGGGFGLYNGGGSFINAGGVINISNTFYDALWIAVGGFTNSGIINIGPAGSNTISYGLGGNSGTFNNTTSGQVNINRVTNAIENLNLVMTNAGTVNIGAETLVSNLFAPSANGLFNNNTGGIFKAAGTIKASSFINAGGTLAPGHTIGKLTFNASEDFTGSIINIEVNGTGTAGVHYDQVAVDGTATLGGTLALSINYAGIAGDQITIFTSSALSGTFSAITGLPANWYVNYTPVSVILSYQPLALNTWTGTVSTAWNIAGNWSGGVPDASDDVTIPNVANDPVISNNAAVAKSVKLQSGGTLTIVAAGILTVNGGSSYGLWNQGTVNNSGTIRSGTTGSTGSYGIYNEAVFNNNSGSMLQADRAAIAGIDLYSGTMANAGTINIGSLVPVNNLITGQAGTFSNNPGGIVKGSGNLSAANFTNNGGTLSPGYSPGKMTFNSPETFTSNILAIEINGAGAAGINFDQVVVSGAATIGGSLNMTVNYTPTLGDQFIIVSASSVTGTFSTVTGLPAGWNLAYYSTTIVATYGVGATTWTGAVSTAWTTAGNWSVGVPDGITDVTIPNVANDPVISTSGISIRSVTVQSGGVLTISASGVVNLNAANGYGILNQGTVHNNGIINMGNTTAAKLTGIENGAIFNNNSGAQLNIDRTTSGINPLNNATGAVFTNGGTIRIGAISGGGFGLHNNGGTFNNAGGVINISNTNYDALWIANGGFTNSGIINIGPAGSNTMSYGVGGNYGTFNNTSSGQLNINRVTNAIENLNLVMTNAGTVTIGAETLVSNLFAPSANGLFNNNAGGIFKATGTVKASSFVNAGGTLAPGHSLGKLTFNASEDFASSIMSLEVNGAGTAGVDFDQVVVNGTATLGGTLALSINNVGVQGNQVTLVSAGSISGTFATVTGLLPNWKLAYTATTVTLTYDLTNTWTGTVNNNWNTAGNWSSGAIPSALNNVVIPNVTIDPIISTAGAVARTIHVMPGGSLTLNATGSLTTNGVLPFNGVNAAIYNQGTMTVKGPLAVKPN
ncbi:MAG: hypothetical protein V4722_22380 [Bacteroidota bacterium]